jgi:hypothetical protein
MSPNAASTRKSADQRQPRETLRRGLAGAAPEADREEAVMLFSLLGGGNAIGEWVIGD